MKRALANDGFIWALCIYSHLYHHPHGPHHHLNASNHH
jgi:hypothetical protein